MRSLSRLALVGIASLVLVAVTSLSTQHASPASADQGVWMSMTPFYGPATQLRTISYGGYASNEVLDLTFFDASGTQANVGQGDTFYASAEFDGSGVVPFRPGDWLSNLHGGWWTMHVVGETSGVTGTLSFYINGSDGESD